MNSINSIPNDMADKFNFLSEILLQRMPKAGSYKTEIPGLELHRKETSHRAENCFNKPIFAMTVQGAKRTLVGNKEYRYGAGYSLLAGIDMPNMSYLTQASPDKPYLVITLNLDIHLTSQLITQLPKTTATNTSDGAVVIQTSPDILNVMQRLVELLDQPEKISLLAPILLQEIHLQLLLGPHGEVLKAINTQGTKSHHILKTINYLRDNVLQPLEVDKLAQMVHMASSTFRKHFKAITSMSPTEYHQHLRLYEAQRLMLEDNQNVTNAGYLVGYESTTQFNREYKRLFGASPRQNIGQLSEA